MGNIVNFAEITTFELRDMQPDATLFILPVSLLEEHGPHLPLGVDLFIAQHMAEELARHIAGYFSFEHILLMPGIPIGAGGIPMTGTIESHPDTVYRVLYEYGTSLARSDFRQGIISNGHAGQTHLDALQRVQADLQKDFDFKMIALGNEITERFLSGQFGVEISRELKRPLSQREQELFAADGHGGWWETSAMLHFRPGLVRPEYKKLAAREDVDELGYKGDPSAADPEIARATVQVFMKESLRVLEKYFPGKSAGEEK